MVKVKKQRNQRITENYCLYLGDACQVVPQLPENSIGLSVFSPPFSSLYSYSDSLADMGNSQSNEEFFEHFSHLVQSLYKVMMPGRIVAVHCMDLPTFKSKGEQIGTYDFPGDINRCFMDQGFIRHAKITIWKDPLVAATRTKSIQLAHKQIVKDSAMCGIGIADEILAFRKPGENPVPIAHPEGLTEYYGSRSVPREYERYMNWQGKQNENKRSHWIWQQYASPVWFDIRQTNTLPYKQAREHDDEKHICPLQLDTVNRCLTLWSAPGDVVLTPFMGIGTEVYCAVEMGRKGIGVELKSSYFRQARKNLWQLDKRLEETDWLKTPAKNGKKRKD